MRKLGLIFLMGLTALLYMGARRWLARQSAKRHEAAVRARRDQQLYDTLDSYCEYSDHETDRAFGPWVERVKNAPGSPVDRPLSSGKSDQEAE